MKYYDLDKLDRATKEIEQFIKYKKSVRDKVGHMSDYVYNFMIRCYNNNISPEDCINAIETMREDFRFYRELEKENEE